ncbi:hypothetical protein ACP70R_023052 [Stipagrostis hirtigluma subsp. patula]
MEERLPVFTVPGYADARTRTGASPYLGRSIWLHRRNG